MLSVVWRTIHAMPSTYLATVKLNLPSNSRSDFAQDLVYCFAFVLAHTRDMQPKRGRSLDTPQTGALRTALSPEHMQLCISVSFDTGTHIF